MMLGSHFMFCSCTFPSLPLSKTAVVVGGVGVWGVARGEDYKGQVLEGSTVESGISTLL